MSEATLRDKKYITEPDWDNPQTSMAAVSVRCTSVYFFDIYFYHSAPSVYTECIQVLGNFSKNFSKDKMCI
jgi:hypothetical protein